MVCARIYALFPPTREDARVETHDGGNCVGRVVFAADRHYEYEGEAKNKISKDRWLLHQLPRSFHLRVFQFVVSIGYLVLFHVVVERLLRIVITHFVPW